MSFNVFTNNNFSLSITSGYQNYTKLIQSYALNGTNSQSTQLNKSTWIPYSPAEFWTCMATNVDGSVIVACTRYNIYIYQNQWVERYNLTPQKPTNIFNSISINYGGNITATTTSTNDTLNGLLTYTFGAESTPSSWRYQNMIQICMSSNAEYQLAIGTNIGVTLYESSAYISSDIGNTFSNIDIRATANCICMTPDGSLQYIFLNITTFLISTDFGKTFSPFSFNINDIKACCISNLLTLYVMVVNSDGIYVSTSTKFDSGTVTFTPLIPVIPDVYSCSMSRDGKSMWCSFGGTVYNSVDFGKSWNVVNFISSPSYCQTISVSGDGKFVSAISFDPISIKGQIYQYTNSIPSTIDIQPTISQVSSFDVPSLSIISLDRMIGI